MKKPQSLKFLKGYLKGTRLIIVLIVAVVLLAGTTLVVVYSISQNKKQPVVEEIQNKSTTPKPKVEPQPQVTEEKPAALNANNGQSSPSSTSSTPASKPAVKPRPHTSEDPAYVACVQKYNDFYIQYNADNARINAEKNRQLAEVDELYDEGYYDQVYEGTDAYNTWQSDRAEIAADYAQRLLTLYNIYEANASPYRNC